MKLLLDQTSYTVAKFSPNSEIPADFEKITGFKSVTYTSEECSVIAPTSEFDVSQALSYEADWLMLKIAGILDFSLTGILNQISVPLAENKISIFALSTYNTDYILLKEADKDAAIQILTQAGHLIV